MRPWRHAVLDVDLDLDKSLGNDYSLDLLLRIESRSQEGERYSEHDLDLEIYKSGTDINLIICWSNRPSSPILWHGKHSVWMDATSGKKCNAPLDSDSLESLARRLRGSFSPSENI